MDNTVNAVLFQDRDVDRVVEGVSLDVGDRGVGRGGEVAGDGDDGPFTGGRLTANGRAEEASPPEDQQAACVREHWIWGCRHAMKEGIMDFLCDCKKFQACGAGLDFYYYRQHTHTHKSLIYSGNH